MLLDQQGHIGLAQYGTPRGEQALDGEAKDRQRDAQHEDEAHELRQSKQVVRQPQQQSRDKQHPGAHEQRTKNQQHAQARGDRSQLTTHTTQHRRVLRIVRGARAVVFAVHFDFVVFPYGLYPDSVDAVV
ncbi:MAG TPA: hypothetical protein DF699_01210 [Phycisphaerales bacterium]|nr:hypothetical protein [Phycisphaerales bacterium]